MVGRARNLAAVLALALPACGGDDSGADGGGVDAAMALDARPFDLGAPTDGMVTVDAGDSSDDAGAGDGGIVSLATVTGRVFDARSQALLAGVTLASEVSSATTTADGEFSLQVPAGIRTKVTVEGPGHAPSLFMVGLEEGAEVYREAFLVPAVVRTLLAEEGGWAGDSGSAVYFPPSALVADDGSTVTGEVSISVASLDPFGDELLAAPGDLEADMDGALMGLESFGMIEVTATQGGRELDVADGAFVTLRVLYRDGPPVVPFWSLDETTGRWVREGNAARFTLSNGTTVYEGASTHLSWFNCDAFFAGRGCVRGCVEDEGAPVPGATVVLNGRNSGRRVFVGDDGCFVGEVPTGLSYSLHAAALSGVTESVSFVGNSGDPAMPSSCVDVGTLSIRPRAASSCPGSTVRCGERCIDIRTDYFNCGDCGNSCGGGEGEDPTGECRDGVCGCSSPGLGVCGFRCVDTRSDRFDCGTCGNACAVGEECVDGACAAIECASVLSLCGSDCVDPQSNSSHCGSCYAACNGGTTCVGGACVCPAGQTDCAGQCRDLQTDLGNCGSCGNACTSDELCTAGICAPPICTTPEVPCGRFCQDLSTNPSSCGVCGRGCQTGTCTDGRCTCPAGEEPCVQVGDGVAGFDCVTAGTCPAGDVSGPCDLLAGRWEVTGDCPFSTIDIAQEGCAAGILQPCVTSAAVAGSSLSFECGFSCSVTFNGASIDASCTHPTQPACSATGVLP